MNVPNFPSPSGTPINRKAKQTKLAVASSRACNSDVIGCGGGKFYTGFTEMPIHVPNFVSLKEKYKKTPEMVTDFIKQIQVPRTEKAYLHFARITE